jgi:hypothetical protein
MLFMGMFISGILTEKLIKIKNLWRQVFLLYILNNKN